MKSLVFKILLGMIMLIGGIESINATPICKGSPSHIVTENYKKWHNCEGEVRYLGYTISKNYWNGLWSNGTRTKPKYCFKNGYEKPPTQNNCRCYLNGDPTNNHDGSYTCGEYMGSKPDASGQNKNNSDRKTFKVSNTASLPCSYDKLSIKTNGKYNCSDRNVCIHAETWDTYHNAYNKEANRRGLACAKLIKKSTPSNLKLEFMRLSKNNRILLQQNLDRAGFYKTTIDGIYGPKTQSALIRYNNYNLKSKNLEEIANVKELFQAVLQVKQNIKKTDAPSKKQSPKPDADPIITSTPTLEPATEINPKSDPSVKPGVKNEPDITKKTAELLQTFGINLYGSFLHSERLPNALFFFDNIENSDSFEFRKALRNHDINLIVLSSPGGSVMEGLSIAGIIHDKKLDTFIPRNSIRKEDGKCASACAFMFFAGESRKANGKLGVHQFYSADSSKKAEVGSTQKIAQFTVSEIIGFLNEFETPPWVYERMFQQSNMYYFKESELLKLESGSSEAQKDNYKETENFITELRAALGDM